MAVKKSVAKKKASVKPNPDKARIAALTAQIKSLREEIREKDKAIKEGQRQVQGLLKILEATEKDVTRFLARRHRESLAKFKAITAPKRRKAAAKKAAKAKAQTPAKAD